MRTLADISEATTPLTEDEARLRHAMQCSPFMKRLLNSDAGLLADILQHMHAPLTGQQMRDWLAEQPVTDEPTLKRALRKLRQRVMVRIITRDLNGLADLHEVTLTISELAEVAVQFALQHHTFWLEETYGKPLGESGAAQQMIVIGMGKLGGY